MIRSLNHNDAMSQIHKRLRRKRLQRDGVVPAIDPAVDLYNAIRLRYAITVGGVSALEPALRTARPAALCEAGDEL